MEINLLDNYVIVRRTSDQQTICAAVVGEDKRLHDIAFPNPTAQRCNRTRQAAMRTLQQAGYR